MSPFPMKPMGGVEAWEPSRAEVDAIKLSTAVDKSGDKPAWTTPVLFLHASEVAPHEVDEAMDGAAYALSQEHQDDLSIFEAALTRELMAKGMPLVFIQPGAPGHKEALREARKHLVQDFSAQEPIKPCDHAAYTKGCRACDFIVVRRTS